MMALPIDEEWIPLVISGKKRSTIRSGQRKVKLGPNELVSKYQSIPITIDNLRYCTVNTLTVSDALDDGFSSLTDLLSALQKYYPNLTGQLPLTIIKFTFSPSP
jgi:hypothetical protein